MAIKQIFMVATAHPLADEKAVAGAFKKAEQELDEAIKEGYTLFAHYPVNAHQLTGQMFVMHKPDDTPANAGAPDPLRHFGVKVPGSENAV